MNIQKTLTGIFWLIMAIHFVVFSTIGFVTGKWCLLWIFLPFLALSIVIKYIVVYFKDKIKIKKKKNNIN
jgi:hypothetical protein